jgi:hypothetical protein
MAQTISETLPLNAWLVIVLEDAAEIWSSLPEVERRLDELDYFEALPYLEEWALQEQRLKRLERHYQAGDMIPKQQRRYEELLEIVGRNRPIVERLLR